MTNKWACRAAAVIAAAILVGACASVAAIQPGTDIEQLATVSPVTTAPATAASKAALRTPTPPKSGGIAKPTRTGTGAPSAAAAATRPDGTRTDDRLAHADPPQPSYASYDKIDSALKYGYTPGEVQGCCGFLRVAVSPAALTVDHVRSYLPQHENAQRQSGRVSYSYTVMPR